MKKEVGCWWIHKLTQSCTSSSEWNLHAGMSFFWSPKCESHKGKDDVEVFPSEISESYPSPDWQYGDRRYHAKKDDSVRQHSRAFWIYGASQHHQPPRINHTFLLFFACLHFQCWTNHALHYANLQSNKEQLCGPVRFHYACLLPYRRDGSVDT